MSFETLSKASRFFELARVASDVYGHDVAVGNVILSMTIDKETLAERWTVNLSVYEEGAPIEVSSGQNVETAMLDAYNSLESTAKTMRKHAAEF